MNKIQDKKILILTACSKKKLPNSAPAKEFYRGQLFQMIRKLASQNNFELRILSGLLGLLTPEEVINPYNHKLQDNIEDIKRVKALTIPKLLPLIPHYDIILVIMGKTYLKVIQPLINSKFIIIFDKRGLFGYLSIVSKWLKFTKNQLLRELHKIKNPAKPLTHTTIEKWVVNEE